MMISTFHNAASVKKSMEVRLAGIALSTMGPFQEKRRKTTNEPSGSGSLRGHGVQGY